MKANILDDKRYKIFRSENYNFNFDRNTGLFMRWGKQVKDDPEFSPFGMEIADIEVSTKCSGVENLCSFCYKANTPNGDNMSLETFKSLFDKFPKTLTQIAFGIGDIEANPDLWKMFEYSREHGVVPNVTINGYGITDDIADKLARICGAVAVSIYDKNYTYDTIKKLTDRGMDQVNIHCMISEETYDLAQQVIRDRNSDERLSKMKAIVFLSLKKKGRGKKGFTQLSQEKFKSLVDLALSEDVAIGFDSCSAFKFLKSVKDHKLYEQMKMSSEPCEASCFSGYFNVQGHYFPCSFIEGTEGWEKGIDIINTDAEFLQDLWHHERTEDFRLKVLDGRKNERSCVYYNI